AGQARREDDLAVFETHAVAIELERVRRDFAGDELADQIERVLVELFGLLRIGEAALAEACFGDGDQRVPVEAVGQVVIQIVVVFEEAHRLTSRRLDGLPLVIFGLVLGARAIGAGRLDWENRPDLAMRKSSRHRRSRGAPWRGCAGISWWKE